MFHQPLKKAQKIAAKSDAQNATASGLVALICRSP